MDRFLVDQRPRNGTGAQAAADQRRSECSELFELVGTTLSRTFVARSFSTVGMDVRVRDNLFKRY